MLSPLIAPPARPTRIIPPGECWEAMSRRRTGRAGRRNAVKPSGAFGPASVTSASLFLWLRADSYTPGATATWVDLSGNGRSPTQVTGGNQPTAGGATIGGKPTVNFASSGPQFLTWAANTFTALTAGEVFAVRRCNSDSALTGLWAIGGSGLSSFAPFAADRNLYDDFASNTRTAAGAPAANGWSNPHCINIIGTATEWSVNFNFAQLLAPISNTVAFPSATRLGLDPGGGTGFDGQLAEFIVYNGKLSTADRNALANTATTSYLRARYGF